MNVRFICVDQAFKARSSNPQKNNKETPPSIASHCLKLFLHYVFLNKYFFTIHISLYTTVLQKKPVML